MPYVEGESLRERIRRERQLPVEDALRIAREAAQALQYAHEPASSTATSSRRTCSSPATATRWWRTSASPGRWAARRRAADRDRPRDRHPGLHEPGAGRGRPRARRPHRRLPPRRRALRDAGGQAALHRGDHAGDAGEAVHRAPRRASGRCGPTCRRRWTTRSGRRSPRSPADRFAPPPSWRGRCRPPAPATAAATTAATPAARRPRAGGPRSAAVTLALGFLLGLGVLFGWLRRHGGERPGAPSEVAARGAALRQPRLRRGRVLRRRRHRRDPRQARRVEGLQVTASRSAAEYKKSSKDLATIARELGVDYLLVGKVRWEKGEAGQSRVRVSPELIQVGDRLDPVGAAVRREPHRRV